MKMLKKIGNFIKNNKYMLLTLILSVFAINFIYISNYVTPYGIHSLLCVDFYHQYGPMMYELWHRILSGSGFVYSFYQGMGLPFFRNFFNYLSSPFNLLLLLFNKDNILKGLSLIIGIKAVASSCTMYHFLEKKFKQKNVLFILISILWAYSAYYRAYYWNLMWIDGMVFLPLIVLGIENIVNQKKWKLYTVSLAIMLFSNYFIGYMICVFSVIYFLFYFIYKFNFHSKEKKKQFKNSIKTIIMYAGSSLLAGGLVAFALIPMASSMMSISATGSSMPTSQYYDFTLVDFIKGHLSCIDTTVFKSDPVNSPNISAGIISVFLFLSYISNIKISKKNKICYTLLYMTVLSMFFIPQFDFIMHAFHVPNDLPYRYSFLYTFVFLIMGTYALINLNKENYIKLCIEFLFTIGLIIICIFEKWDFITNNMLYVNIIIISLFYLFYSLGRFLKNFQSIFFVALSFVAVIDACESTNESWNITQIESGFVSSTNEIDEAVDYIKQYDNTKFYRIDSTEMHTLNDASISYYNGITTFSSMAYESLAQLQRKLGTPGNDINSYEYIQQTPIYDLMFDVKYIMGSSIDTVRYENLNTNTEKNIYKFNYTVGLGFGVNRDVTKWEYSEDNPFKVQNDFVEKTSGLANMFKKLPVVSSNREKESTMRVEAYNYLNTGDNIYLNWKSSSISFVIVDDTIYAKDDNYLHLENTTYKYYEEYNDDKIIAITSSDKYLKIIVGYNYFDEDALNIYYIDNNLFVEYYKDLLENSLTITSFKEDDIKGKIYLDENQTVYTSIPYDDGWEVYVDGKKVSTFYIGNALLGFNAIKGQHTVEFKYHVPYFKLGLCISIISIIFYVLATFKDKLNYRLSNKIKRKTKKA